LAGGRFCCVRSLPACDACDLATLLSVVLVLDDAALGRRGTLQRCDRASHFLPVLPVPPVAVLDSLDLLSTRSFFCFPLTRPLHALRLKSSYPSLPSPSSTASIFWPRSLFYFLRRGLYARNGSEVQRPADPFRRNQIFKEAGTTRHPSYVGSRLSLPPSRSRHQRRQAHSNRPQSHQEWPDSTSPSTSARFGLSSR